MRPRGIGLDLRRSLRLRDLAARGGRVRRSERGQVRPQRLEEEEDPVAAKRAAFLERFLFAMPEKAEDLLPEERRAYAALVAATHVRAEALGERWVWNIAMSRSLLEMTRRLPTSMPQLRAVWGLGGTGVRAARHGDALRTLTTILTLTLTLTLILP